MNASMIKTLLLIVGVILAIGLLAEIQFAYVTVLPVAVGIWWLLVKTNPSDDEGNLD